MAQVLVNVFIYITDKNMQVLLQYCSSSFAKYCTLNNQSFCNTQNYTSYKNLILGTDHYFLRSGVGWVLAIFWGINFSCLQVVLVFLSGQKLVQELFKKSNTRPGEQTVHVLLFFHYGFPCIFFSSLFGTAAIICRKLLKNPCPSFP